MNCSHNIYEVDDGFKGTAAEVAKHLGVSNAMVYATEQRKGKTKGHRIKLENCGRNKATEYEVYDGEEKIFVGTSEEIAKKFAVTSYTARGVNWRNSKTGKAKMLWKYGIKKVEQ